MLTGKHARRSRAMKETSILIDLDHQQLSAFIEALEDLEKSGKISYRPRSYHPRSRGPYNSWASPGVRRRGEMSPAAVVFCVAAAILFFVVCGLIGAK